MQETYKFAVGDEVRIRTHSLVDYIQELNGRSGLVVEIDETTCNDTSKYYLVQAAEAPTEYWFEECELLAVG